MSHAQSGQTVRDPEHESRALGALAASARIPFYAKRGSPVEGAPNLRDALSSTPLLWKKDLRATLPRQWVPAGRDVKAELASGEIELVETSGSTADRTRILWDKGWWLRQEERAMRTNGHIARAMDGESGPYREAILTTPVCGLGVCHTGDTTFEERVEDRFLFLNMRPDPAYWQPPDMTRMLDELERHHTVGLEADPTYLAALSRYAAENGRRIAVSGFATLTYALTSAAHRRTIQRTLEAPTYQLYGASEVGVLFMEGEDGKLHHCPLTTHVELLPVKLETPGARDVALVVVTTMDRVVQPLVRFVLGDLVQVARDAGSRFTTVPPLLSIEGRVHDAVLRPDGALVTAGAIDRALAPVTAIAAYQVNQTSLTEVVADVVPERAAGAGIVDEALARLAPLLAGVDVKARRATAIPAESSGKYRTTRRHFPLDMGKVAAGCEGVML